MPIHRWREAWRVAVNQGDEFSLLVLCWSENLQRGPSWLRSICRKASALAGLEGNTAHFNRSELDGSVAKALLPKRLQCAGWIAGTGAARRPRITWYASVFSARPLPREPPRPPVGRGAVGEHYPRWSRSQGQAQHVDVRVAWLARGDAQEAVQAARRSANPDNLGNWSVRSRSSAHACASAGCPMGLPKTATPC